MSIIPSQHPAPGTPEKLTDAVIKRLIGHTDVVYYNFDTNAWNTTCYNGCNLADWQHVDTANTIEFKTAMDQEPDFCREYEFVASIVMTINKSLFPGFRELVAPPSYSRTGTAIVGNIIARNRRTGKCELYGKTWIGVGNYAYPNYAVWCGANIFARNGAAGAKFRHAIITSHTR